MNIVQMKVADIIPYDKNPRNNDNAVQYVAESIKEFGFKVPIVIDKDNVIVAGHTRLKAAKKLKIKEVPCIVADDLTDEQIKAFRLADNKVSEQAEWDFDLLAGELDDLFDFDMTVFGFEMPDYDEEPEEESINERHRTGDAYNLDDYHKERVAGFYQMPMLERIDYVPDDLIGFNYAMTSKQYEAGIHFYIDDYQFERIWGQPYSYLDTLRQYDCILTPDFSLYMDMPMAMKIWNVYRSRLIGQICQDNGICVIPTVSWAEEDTFQFAFDGIPTHSTISVSTIGVKKDKEAMQVWKVGMDKAIEILKPKNILVYGGEVDYNFGDINVKFYENKVTENMKNYSTKEKEMV